MAKEQEYTMDTELIRMFRQVVPELAGGPRSFTEVNELAIKRGYLVVPEACTGAVMDWLKDEKFDPNATFFKDWQYIQEHDNISLMFEQILHYITTYGTDFALGNGYVPNDGKDKPMMAYDKLKLVTAVSADELKARCMGMLKSGVSMKQSTVRSLVDFVVATGGCPADEIPNREAACLLHFRQGTHPSDPVEYVRFLVYLYTDTTLLIKNRDTIRRIRTTGDTSGIAAVAAMSDADIDLLATVFYRFRPLLVAMKAKDSCAPCTREVFARAAHVINRIRARADKLKRPFVPGILDRICEPGDSDRLASIEAALDGTTMFRRLRLLQCVIDRMSMKEGENPVYTVRNGKMFIREGYRPKADHAWLTAVSGVLTGSIRESLARKASTFRVRLPARETCAIAMPTSEKNFIGDYPMGTRVHLSEHNVVGVYWRNEWGTRDFDLSMFDKNGHGVSWHTGFKDGDFMHSGDMTNADPEASECIYFRGPGISDKTSPADGMVLHLNQYCGINPESRYRMYVARYEGRPKFSHGYMVDPKDVVLTVDGNIPGGQTALAVVSGSDLILLGVGTGNGRVTLPGGSTTSFIEAISSRYMHAAHLKALLQLCGFDFVPYEHEGEVDLDLSDIKRDTLIEFFSEKKE